MHRPSRFAAAIAGLVPLALPLLALSGLAGSAGCESTGRPTAPKTESRKTAPKWSAVDDLDEAGPGYRIHEETHQAFGVPAAGAGPSPVPPPVMLGVRLRPIDPVLATHLGVDPRHASVIEDVAEELNGHAGGLRDHDVIVGVDGAPRASLGEIRRVLRSKEPGQTIAFDVVRGSARTSVTVTLDRFELSRFMSATPARIGG